MTANKVLVGELNGCNMLSPKVRAEQVWKAFLDDIDEQDGIMWSQNMNNALQLYLDADSIASFVHLVVNLYKNFEKEEQEKRVSKASNGRRLIGATTRDRVKKEAEAFRHMTKSDASYEISKIIGKDSGHVKRYLTELFPGDKWKTTKQ